MALFTSLRAAANMIRVSAPVKLQMHSPASTLAIKFRSLSTSESKLLPHASSTQMKERTAEFVAVLPEVLKDISDELDQLKMPEITQRTIQAVEHTVLGGEYRRGVTMVDAYKFLEDPKKITPESLKLAITMGWCIEMLQGYILLQDDILDQSQTRRGKPCWYLLEGVAAANDSLLIQSAMYNVIRKHLKDKPYYTHVFQMFNIMQLETCIGQHLDFAITGNGKPYLHKFSLKNYCTMVDQKTTYYPFYMPLRLSMVLCGMDDTLSQEVKDVLYEISILYQIRNDIWDCFKDPNKSGKIASDIQDGKCTWLAVKALEIGNPEQKEIMKKYYGVKDKAAEQEIINLFEELKIPSLFREYEEESYNRLNRNILKITNLPHNYFYRIRDNVYKRSI